MNTKFLFASIIMMISICEICALGLYGIDQQGNYYSIDDQNVNGSTSLITKFPINIGICAMDKYYGIVYCIGNNKSHLNIVTLIGLDALTGTERINYPTIFISGDEVGENMYIDVDQTTGDVYFAGPIEKSNSNQHLLLKLSYLSQTVVKIGFFNHADYVGFGSFSTCDPSHNTLWAITPSSELGTSTNNLIGISMLNGSIHTNITIPSIIGMKNIAYDDVTNNLYGFGYYIEFLSNQVNFTVQLVSFDTQTHSFSLVRKLNPQMFFFLELQLSAITVDSTNRIVYALLQSPSAITYVYQFDIESGDQINFSQLDQLQNMLYLYDY